MLKRKLLMTILPVLSAAVIAGAGFSAWHFDEISTADTDMTINTNVEPAFDYSISVSKTTEPNKLSLDQGTPDSAASGISFVKDTTDTNLVLQVEQSGGTASFTSLDFEITITLDEELNTYLDFNTTSLSSIYDKSGKWTSAGVTTDKTITLKLSGVDFSGDQSYTFTLNNGDHNYLLDYADGQKPQIYTAWGDMKEALTGSSMTIDVSVTAKL